MSGRVSTVGMVVMVETSQSVMRVVALIFFTMIFAGAWANDRPRERMVQIEMPHPALELSHEKPEPGALVQSEFHSEVASAERTDITLEVTQITPEIAQITPETTPVEPPALEELKPVVHGMTLTLSVETEGLTLKKTAIQEHLQHLPLGIANGDYLMVDSLGGVGWLRIRGQQQLDTKERFLTTAVGEAQMQYIRVTPLSEILTKPTTVPITVPTTVPAPVGYAASEIKTLR